MSPELAHFPYIYRKLKIRSRSLTTSNEGCAARLFGWLIALDDGATPRFFLSSSLLLLLLAMLVTGRTLLLDVDVLVTGRTFFTLAVVDVLVEGLVGAFVNVLVVVEEHVEVVGRLFDQKNVSIFVAVII